LILHRYNFQQTFCNLSTELLFSNVYYSKFCMMCNLCVLCVVSSYIYVCRQFHFITCVRNLYVCSVNIRLQCEYVTYLITKDKFTQHSLDNAVCKDFKPCTRFMLFKAWHITVTRKNTPFVLQYISNTP